MGKNVLSEEALTDKFFQVLPEAFVVGDFVSLIVVIRTVIFHYGKCRIMLD